MIFLFIVLMVCGISMILRPEFWLRLEDMFRIRGERDYSSVGLAMMVFRGVFVTIGGIVALFMYMAGM